MIGLEGPSTPPRWRAARTVAVLLGVSLLAAACEAKPPGPTPEAWIEIGGRRVAIEIADTPAKQRRGLGYRDRLDWDHGMYFHYDVPRIQTFWMKGMRFSIDIVWIRDGRIVDFHGEVPFVPGENGPTVRPREMVDGVLEVPAGYARASGWRIGDPVKLERAATATR